MTAPTTETLARLRFYKLVHDSEYQSQLLVRHDGKWARRDDCEKLAASVITLTADNAALRKRVEELEGESKRLGLIIARMDGCAPVADNTCAEPGITLSEAVMRQWPELRAALNPTEGVEG